MCILFVYSAQKASPAAAALRIPYKLIVATNRDEFLARPTKEAAYWDSPDNDILGGKDLQSGGTWFGINRVTGKLGILLNIMGGTKQELTTSRGSIITSFLRSPKHLTGWTYCRNLAQDPSLDILHNFSHFNFVAIDLLQDGHGADANCEESARLAHSRQTGAGQFPWITYFTNAGSQTQPAEPENITTSFFSLGNSVRCKPFQKTLAGERMFAQIVNATVSTATSSTSKDELKSQLLQFLKSTDKHYPDPVTREHSGGRPDEFLRGGSSIYLEPSCFDHLYGTRTHTIALVDHDNNVDFHEWTLKNPTDAKAPVPEWTESHFNFRIPQEA